MKLSTSSMHHPERFNSLQQIVAHLGGMIRAFVRHYPINWTFHWRGICRAILSEGWDTPQKEQNKIGRQSNRVCIPSHISWNRLKCLENGYETFDALHEQFKAIFHPDKEI